MPSEWVRFKFHVLFDHNQKLVHFEAVYFSEKFSDMQDIACLVQNCDKSSMLAIEIVISHTKLWI